MIKDFIRAACQNLLGFDNYLYIFSLVNYQRMRTHIYEKEFLYFMNMLPGEGAILDIGANIGVMTIALAKSKPHSTIYSFEPVPANLKAIKRVIRFYQLTNVEVFPIALGDENSMVKLVLPRKKKARMHGLSHVIRQDEAIEQGEVFSIPMQRMDDIAALNAQINITAIKIDVENFELYVLQGGRELLKKHRPLIYCELWDNSRRPLCLGLIKELGYRVMIYYQGRLVDFTGQKTINFFFLP